MDTIAIFFILHILFRRTTTVIPLVFRVREGLTGCASVMHSPFLLSGGPQIRTAEPLVLYFTSSAPKMVDPRSIVGGRQYRDIR